MKTHLFSPSLPSLPLSFSPVELLVTLALLVLLEVPVTVLLAVLLLVLVALVLPVGLAV